MHTNIKLWIKRSLACLLMALMTSTLTAGQENKTNWQVRIKQLFASLDEKDDAVRMKALQGMKVVDRPEAVKALLEIYRVRIIELLELPSHLQNMEESKFLDAFPAILGHYHDEKAVRMLVKFGLKSRNIEVRHLAIRVFAISKEPSGVDQLQKMMNNHRIFRSTRILCIRALAAIGAPESLDLFLELGSGTLHWDMQIPLLQGFRAMNSMRCVKQVIPLLSSNVMKVRSEALQTLIAVTGYNFNRNQVMWQKWYDKNSETIENGSMTRGSYTDPAGEESIVDYHGIPVTSDRLLFVLDISESMRQYYEGGKDHSGVIEEGITKFRAMQNEMVRVIKALPMDAEFTIITFATKIRMWKPEPTQATARGKKAAIQYIEDMSMALGTETGHAMEKAFEVIGILDKKGNPVVATGAPLLKADTIFLLSDGMPFRMREGKGKAGKAGPLPTAPILNSIRSWNRAWNISINTIFLGGGKEHELKIGIPFLRDMAEQNNGSFTHQ